MIKIISGYSGPGGSTEAFINLTNEFNKRGYEACFYGNGDYPKGKCNYVDNFNTIDLRKDDKCIFHLMRLSSRPPVDKCILSCHEQSDLRLNQINLYPFDKIHCVAQHQWEYHKIKFPHFIVGNIYDEWMYERPVGAPLEPTAGVIGLIYPNKNTHIAIDEAIKDGFKDIIVCGKVKNHDYFNKYVKPRLNDDVKYLGHIDKKQMYKLITDLYVYSELECLPSVIAEAKLRGVNVHTDETKNYTKAKYWLDKNEVINVWKKELGLD